MSITEYTSLQCPPFTDFHMENQWHVYVAEQAVKTVSQIKRVNLLGKLLVIAL